MCFSKGLTSEDEHADTEPWTHEEVCILLTQLFGSKTVHSVYLCSSKCCVSLSKSETRRIVPKRFNHQTFITKKNWWLVYVEGEGMYCTVCKKHCMKHSQNNAEVFSADPSVRFKHSAIITHKNSKVHRAALENELVQKVSCFHHEFTKKSEHDYMYLQRAFSVAYFLMKNFIANAKFEPLLKFIENTCGDDTLKYFHHSSGGSRQEIFMTIGETVMSNVVDDVKNAETFGILTDEVADISVTENLVTFIQYYSKSSKQVETKFLSCQNILEKFQSANAMAIKSLLVSDISEKGLDIKKLTGFSSDGASVMMGKDNGVAALLRSENPSMINIHCVCHRLALACTDSNESLTYIKTVEILLRQLWQFFENSPKQMAAYIKMQTVLKSIYLDKQGTKTVTRRLKKACRTRWLSLDASVTAVKKDFEPILQTLAMIQETQATAHGLLRKMKNLKFYGTIYVLSDILPILSELSRHFQKGSLNFAAILPALSLCKMKLKELKETNSPLQNLSQDIDSFTEMSSEIKFNQKEAKELENLLHRYIDTLIINLEKRFSENSAILEALSIFDPTTVPKSTEPGFKNYGVNHVTVLADHFFTEARDKDKLQTQWAGFKFHICDILLPGMPEDLGKMTPTEWLLLQLLRSSGLRHFNPQLVYLAEVAASLPVTNAWPERGASVLKIIKTKQRNRLGVSMMETLMHVGINGPPVEQSEEVIKTSVSNWLKTKTRRKVKPMKQTLISSGSPASTSIMVEDAAVQTDQVMVSRDEIKTVIKEMMLEDCASNSESESDDVCL
ncbi:zinc finger protein 862-like isoform X2 [Ruditapes philippinarum]|nr:zinc finger protein 862-like isoform X2 [Ruditapes philippinarum]